MMIDNSRRKLLQFMVLLGFGAASGGLILARTTLKERKKAYYARQSNVTGYGYYGFGETW